MKSKPPVFPKLLVVHEKHGDRYFLLSSEEDFRKAALKLVRERVVCDFFRVGEPEKPSTQETWIDSHPSSAVRKAALDEWRRYKLDLSNAKVRNEASLLAHAAIATGNGEMAIEAMNLHRDYEYEGYNIEPFERVEE